MVFSSPVLLFEVSLGAPWRGVIKMQLMKVRCLIAVTLLSVVTGLCGSCAKEAEEPSAEAEEVQWLTSFDEALKAAQKKNQPVMIDFYADWCGWCKRLDSGTYVDDAVVSKSAEFVSLKLDADVERSISSKYRVAALPTILFLDAHGEEIHRVVGFRPPERFLNEMEIALQAFRTKVGS